MKSLILMVVMFSMMLTAITILKHESSKLDLKIQTANDLKNKLQYDLSFLKIRVGIFIFSKKYRKII